ncbi:hypothetical protein EJ08DRAFT_676944 [Tothia fuscella]|uniref:Uncharacterized protein n=1 Tax=Tothia fuscella TaxID=1048955 RepID=A0A9P4NXE3_9PEZI|nr:hypothetical protein EJ08DRAFT_676944 [Tothia fuscella]
MLLPTNAEASWVKSAAFSKRASTDPSGMSPASKTVVVITIVVIILISLAIVTYVVFKNNRASRKSPKYIPGDNLVRKFKRWRHPSRGEYSNQLQPNASAPSLIRPNRSGHPSRDPSPNRSTLNLATDPERGDIGMGASVDRSASTAAGGVDRNTSVRSVMTLPAYNPNPSASERILAREGERGGIDVVLEFPESIDEEEQRRDEEMESLYQIRRARRQEQAEREERRRQRREARARGDLATVQRLQTESRLRAENAAVADIINSAALIAEHQAIQQGRERRVSSVQYADLGVARHDGSRLRANSTDSDNRPLLDSAASISGMSLEPSGHSRGRSVSSVLSVSTAASENGSPRITPPSVGLDENGYEFISLEPTRSRSHSHASSRRGEGGDVTDLGIQIPTEHPPQYDDLSAGPWGEAPPYSSPVVTQQSAFQRGHERSASGAPQLPGLALVPSIEVTSVVSPIMRTP